MLKWLLLDNQQLRIDFRNLKGQVGQLATNQNTRHTGALPKDTEKNPIEQVQAITLKNGRKLEELPSKKKKEYVPERDIVAKLVKEAKKKDGEQRQEIDVRPPPPFPQRLQKQKDDAQYKKFWGILSKVCVNIPLVKILQEVPKYAKYLRDIVANKGRHSKFETVTLTEECSVRVQSKLPSKLKDPGYFTITLAIGKHKVGRSLCDFRASII